jgi:GntR family transcriptional regulator
MPTTLNHPFPSLLQQDIERAILNHEFPKGSLVTASELAARFAAGIQDVELVMQSEIRKGLAARRSHAYEILGLESQSLDSLFQHTARAGMNPASHVRAAVIEATSETGAAKLGIPAGSAVYRLERTRLVNGEVLANQVNYIPYEICPGLENDDISSYSLQKLLEERYHTIITTIQEEIGLVPGSPEDREILGLPDGSDVLVVERLSYSCTGMPVVWASIHIRTDRYPSVAALWPKAAALLSTEINRDKNQGA